MLNGRIQLVQEVDTDGNEIVKGLTVFQPSSGNGEITVQLNFDDLAFNNTAQTVEWWYPKEIETNISRHSITENIFVTFRGKTAGFERIFIRFISQYGTSTVPIEFIFFIYQMVIS